MRECRVEFITGVHYEESVWRGGRGSLALYIGCVYMPTDCTNRASFEGCYKKLKECLTEKGRVVLLGDFNATIGKSEN